MANHPHQFGIYIKNLFLILILVALIFSLVGCVKETVLQSGLTDSDANEIITLLKRNGVIVSKTQSKTGVILLVREDQLPRASDLMQAASLPRKNQSDFGQVFKKEGMISTPTEERARYLYALSQELENTLSQIEGVIVARVHVVLPERVAPGEPVHPSSASVFLKVTEPFDQDLIVPRVKRLVSTSIPGLNTELDARKLSVIIVPSQKLEAVNMNWQQVGPFIVESSSVESLRGLALALFTIIIILIVLVVYLLQGRFLGLFNKTRVASVPEKNTKSDKSISSEPTPNTSAGRTINPAT